MSTHFLARYGGAKAATHYNIFLLLWICRIIKNDLWSEQNCPFFQRLYKAADFNLSQTGNAALVLIELLYFISQSIFFVIFLLSLARSANMESGFSPMFTKWKQAVFLNTTQKTETDTYEVLHIWWCKECYVRPSGLLLNLHPAREDWYSTPWSSRGQMSWSSSHFSCPLTYRLTDDLARVTVGIPGQHCADWYTTALQIV